jgi:hypothetical protein
MVSLKMTDAQAKAEGYGKPEDIKPPEYPWGTRLTVNNDVVKALFPGGMPKIGAEMPVSGKVRVTGVVEEDRQGEPPRLSVDLQMTELDVVRDEKPNVAERMYPGGTKA